MDPDGQSFLEAWNRQGITGAGKILLEKRTAETADALLAFLADGRLPVPATRKFGRKYTKKERRGKTVNYAYRNKEIGDKLDVSRRTEWEKLKKLVAGRPCRGKVLQKLLAEGHDPIPMRWGDVDKASHLRRPVGPVLPPEYKSR